MPSVSDTINASYFAGRELFLAGQPWKDSLLNQGTQEGLINIISVGDHLNTYTRSRGVLTHYPHGLVTRVFWTVQDELLNRGDLLAFASDLIKNGIVAHERRIKEFIHGKGYGKLYVDQDHKHRLHVATEAPTMHGHHFMISTRVVPVPLEQDPIRSSWPITTT